MRPTWYFTWMEIRVSYRVSCFYTNMILTPMISDYYTSIGFGPDAFGGELEYDDEGNPEKYTFRITDYMSQVLSSRRCL